MTNQKEKEELDPLVMRVGANFDLTQGVGGNVSFKADEVISIKGSGKRLSAHADSNFYYRVRRTRGSFIDDIPNQEGKPSIEVFMHAFFEAKFVLHLHSAKAVALGMMCEIDPHALQAAQAVAKVLPYARPGQALLEEMKLRVAPDFQGSLLLSNHGVLHVSNSVMALANQVNLLERAAEEYFTIDGPLALNPSTLSIQVSPELKNQILWHMVHNWRISPDHCVFLGAQPNDSLLNSVRHARTLRDMIQGTFQDQFEISVSDEQLLWFFNVASLLPQRELPTLTIAEAHALQDWDAEKHRVALSQVKDKRG